MSPSSHATILARKALDWGWLAYLEPRLVAR